MQIYLKNSILIWNYPAVINIYPVINSALTKNILLFNINKNFQRYLLEDTHNACTRSRILRTSIK